MTDGAECDENADTDRESDERVRDQDDARTRDGCDQVDGAAQVARSAGEPGGFPLIVMCREGWFWLIPLDERRTSVGLVMAASLAKKAGVASRRMLAWGIANCPLVRRRMRDATGAEDNEVIADFSYCCRPYAGPGTSSSATPPRSSTRFFRPA